MTSDDMSDVLIASPLLSADVTRLATDASAIGLPTHARIRPRTGRSPLM